MRNFNENTITDAVVKRISGTPDPRLKQICTSLVRHLHDFVRDVRLTEAEWAMAIDFLTRTGKTCDGNRQEFILLSDTLGVSMLVDAINHGGAGSTESTVVGPFYVQDPPEHPLPASRRTASWSTGHTSPCNSISGLRPPSSRKVKIGRAPQISTSRPGPSNRRRRHVSVSLKSSPRIHRIRKVRWRLTTYGCDSASA